MLVGPQVRLYFGATCAHVRGPSSLSGSSAAAALYKVSPGYPTEAEVEN